MNPERYELIASIFAQARDLTGQERERLLQQRCGADAELRREVEEYLMADDAQVRSALDRPAVSATQLRAIQGAEAEDYPAGTTVGRYTIRERIGEGGFGNVYLAEQTAPVHRMVAIKIMKAGLDTKSVLARFRQEQQALAVMDHPNVARVFDGGETDKGRSYFVMEYMDGSPITRFCDQHRYTIRQRLELFISVCEAVQHAHMKGIIHRDIKPSNILVGMQGDRAIAKVIDFGIAKAIDQDAAEQTAFTERGQLLGTPEYMSPEQAGAGDVDVDTRTDVYSLGAVLYELLTGVPPFDPRELRSKGYAEIQRFIREVDPPTPSDRMATLLPEVASRSADTRSLTVTAAIGQLRRELEWVPLKAMRKDRARRYASAEALGTDVRQYLEHKPLEAAPESRWYLTRKFIRRNRVQAVATGAVALVLVVGLTGTIWQAHRANERASAAEKAEKAEKARADELKQVSDFLAQMLGQIDTTKAGVELMMDVRERFVAALEKAGVSENERTARADELSQELARVNATDAAAAMIDRTIMLPALVDIDKRFKDQPVVDARLRQALADLYKTIGLYSASYPLQESALATRRRVLGEEHPDTLESMNEMGVLLYYQGKLPEAETYYRGALEKFRRVLGEEHTSTITSITNMGGVLRQQGKLNDAEPYTREALEKCRRVLGEDHPKTLTSISNMGFLLWAQGKLAEAEPYLSEGLEKSRRVLGEEHADTLISINNMGVLLRTQGKLAEAEPYLREALEKRRRVLGEEHPNTISSIYNMGGLLRQQGKLAEAEPYLREALEKRRRVLGEEHPNTLISMSDMGGLLRQQGRHREAIDLLIPAEPAARKAFTGGNAPRLASFLSTLAHARMGLGYEAERFALAEANLLEAHQIFVAAPDYGPMHQHTLNCAKGLIDLYTAWDAVEPGKGYGHKAADWRTKRVAAEQESLEPSDATARPSK